MAAIHRLTSVITQKEERAMAMQIQPIEVLRGQVNLGPRDAGALPPQVAARIAAGEAAVKVLREWRGLSQIELADRSGAAITQITRAERGYETSPAVLRCLARALRVTDDLLLG